MVATEIFLIAAGVICVVVSVVMSFGDDKENVESSAKAELTQAQLDMVKHQDDEVKIDGNMAIAWSGSLNFTVEKSSKSLIGSAVSGEGLVNVYRGTGSILMAPTA